MSLILFHLKQIYLLDFQIVWCFLDMGILLEILELTKLSGLEDKEFTI